MTSAWLGLYFVSILMYYFGRFSFSFHAIAAQYALISRPIVSYPHFRQETR